MAIKVRKGEHTMDAATGSFDIGLGGAYARVLGFEFKGDDANVDLDTTIKLTDRDGRVLLAATALDAGTDDSTDLDTSQDFSTVGVRRMLSVNEAEVVDESGTAFTATEGVAEAPIARSPITVDLAAGTSGDAFQVLLYVEV